MTEFLLKDFQSFEEQLITFIQAYYNLLTQDVIDVKTEEGRNILIQYIVNNTTQSNYIKEFLYKPKFEFNNHIAILQLFFEKYQSELRKIEDNSLKKRQCFKGDFEIKLTRTINKEIINYRNYAAHERFISDEHIQRIYEDEYFYLFYINLPIMRNVLSQYSIKQIKLNIKNSLAVNLNKEQSFSLNYQGYKELLPNLNEYCYDNISQHLLNNKEMIEMFTIYTPKQLFNFECFNCDNYTQEEYHSEKQIEDENNLDDIQTNNNNKSINFGNETKSNINLSSNNNLMKTSFEENPQSNTQNQLINELNPFSENTSIIDNDRL